VTFHEAILDSLIEPAPLERAGKRELPVLSMTMHEGLVDQMAKFKKRVASPDTADYKVARRNQLVVGFPIDEGVLSFQDLYDEAIVSPAYDIWNLRTSDEIEPAYLERFLRSPRALAFYRTKLRGTTARRRTLPDDIFLKLGVPLPPLPEQRRIAEILDKADALQAMRRAALAQLDTLAQSIFLDMFGDPATNPKGWPRKQISDVATVITGNTPSRAKPQYYGDVIEWIKSDNINTPHYFLTQADEGLSEMGRQIARVAPAHSILVTCIAGSPDCIGNSAMTDREVAFNQQINAVVPFEGNAHFVYGQLRVGKRLIQQASTAAMKGMVNKSRFERIVLIWPPGPLQERFAERVSAVEEAMSNQRASFDSMAGLFASLQERAFRGEL
jgi:type I restriction enzyme S subunit